MTLFRLLLVLLLTLPLAVTAQEQVRKSDVVRLLQKLQNAQNDPAALRALGFQGEKLDLMVDHGSKLANNRAVLGFMADRLINARRSGARNPQLSGFLTPLLDRGMPYLPVSEQVYHMKVEVTVMRAMSTANCGRSVKSTINPEVFGRALVQTMARLNAPALKEYLRVVRKATTLGVSKPNPPRISAAKRDAVMGRFAAKMQISAAENGLSRAFERAETSLTRLNNKDACNLGLLFIDTIINTKGADQRPLLQLYWRDFN